jgi:hypothetical protein
MDGPLVRRPYKCNVGCIINYNQNIYRMKQRTSALMYRGNPLQMDLVGNLHTYVF